MKRKFLLKKIIKLRKNVQNKKKILHFKKKKWQKLQQFLHKTNYKYINFFDSTKHITNFYTEYFTNNHRDNLYAKQRFCYYYGSFKVKYIKNIIKKSSNYTKKFSENKFKNTIETRIDTLLYRSHFVDTVKKARQLVLHKCVKVNGFIIKSSSFLIKIGDCVTVNSKYFHLIKNNIENRNIWPFPPEYIQVNYKTLQFILISNPSSEIITNQFSFIINFDQIVQYYRYH